MSLPASNRKAPSRAMIVATLTAFTALGASSVAVADVSKPGGHGHPQQTYGYGLQTQLPAGFGYGQQAPNFAFPGFGVQPASTYGGVAAPAPAPQGYAAPAVPNYAAPAAPGYGAPAASGYGGVPQPFPGYGVPGGFPAPTPGAQSSGFGPYGYGLSSQWANFAPSEPNYAPAERVGTAPAAQASTAPAAPAATPVQSATVATTTSDYSYEVAPANSSTYVGTTAQISTGADPYQAIIEQQTTPPQPTYQAVQPGYTQQYEAAPAPAPAYVVQEPAPAPAPNYTVAAPAPAPQAPVNVGGYEYQAVPQQPAADYYDLSAQNAAAAAAAPAVAPAPAYEVSSYAPQGTHFVQVGAFLDPARANNLLNKLGSSGIQAFIVPAQVRGKLYHRVRIGAGSKRDARLVLDQVRGLNYYEARIVRG